MKRDVIKVPKGINFISDWKEFKIPEEICIMNKTITGCGFTEYCLTNNEFVILCSPRKILLENKSEQHCNDSFIYYFKNEIEVPTNTDKDLTKQKPSKKDQTENILSESEQQSYLMEIINKFNSYLDDYYCKLALGVEMKPLKILVTYDSFRHVREVLEKRKHLENFQIIVDEFQSIFTDAKFKSSSELEFLTSLKGLNKICFVSATPMIDKYLDMLEEFKNLPYYELDWETEDPNRIINPILDVHRCYSVVGFAVEEINKYKEGIFEKTTFFAEDKSIKEVVSKEAVLYVNSVKNICDIIKKCELTLDNTNILCARTEENEKQLRKALKLSKRVYKGSVIGKVPLKDEPRKMFTICTRTVYLGADFYSDNARSFIFSDANIDSLTVDITIDLPQILGRQRDFNNPWKNRASLYYKTLDPKKEITQEDFDRIIEKKKSVTEDLLYIYNNIEKDESGNLNSEKDKEKLKESLARKYEKDSTNYRDDYVAINHHAGHNLLPVFNKLVLVNDIRSYELQQIEYKDRFKVINAVKDVASIEKLNNDTIKLIREIESIKHSWDRLRYIYELNMPDDVARVVLNNLEDLRYAKYYWSISKERAGTLKYMWKQLEEEYIRINRSNIDTSNIETEIYDTFEVGKRYLKTEIKEKLQKIYDNSGYSSTAKAQDLNKYFEIMNKQIIDKETKKKLPAFELLKKKEKKQ